MAVNNITVYNPANDGMALPLSITRGNPNPLDDTYLYATLADAQTYATSGATAYVGQTLCVLNTDKTDGVPTVYVITDTAGTLKALGGASDIFSDTQFTSLKARVDVLDNVDETTVGSVNYAIDQSKVTVELDPAVTSGATYNIYQGQTITKTPIVDGSGNPILDTDGNPTYTVTKTPVKIGSIGIDADLFISGGSVVDVTTTPAYYAWTNSITSTTVYTLSDTPVVTDNYYDNTFAVQTALTAVGASDITIGTDVYARDNTVDVAAVSTDSEGDTCSVAEGRYLKLNLSNNTSVYIATKDLAKGLVDSIKLATGTLTPDANGDIDMTGLSTDDITPGTVDTWILNGGNATT